MKKKFKFAPLSVLVVAAVLALSGCTFVFTGGARVLYDDNNATEGNVPVDPYLYSYGDTATVLDNTGNLTKSGCVFVGWNTNADGSGTPYYPGSPLYMDSFMVILYAQWMPVTKIPDEWSLTYTWDDGVTRSATWTINSDKTFYDNKGGHGLWDISVNTIQLFYSNGTSYVFPYPYEGTNYLGNMRGWNFMFGTMTASPRGSYQPQGNWHAERSTAVYSQSTKSVLESGSITPSGEVVK